MVHKTRTLPRLGCADLKKAQPPNMKKKENYNNAVKNNKDGK